MSFLAALSLVLSVLGPLAFIYGVYSLFRTHGRVPGSNYENPAMLSAIVYLACGLISTAFAAYINRSVPLNGISAGLAVLILVLRFSELALLIRCTRGVKDLRNIIALLIAGFMTFRGCMAVVMRLSNLAELDKFTSVGVSPVQLILPALSELVSLAADTVMLLSAAINLKLGKAPRGKKKKS